MSEEKKTKTAGKAKSTPATQEDENIRGYRRFEGETVVYIGPRSEERRVGKECL